MRRHQIGHDVEAGGRLAVGDAVGDDLDARIFRGDLFLEALGALIQRPDARQRGDDGDIAGGLAGLRLDAIGQRIGRDLAAGELIGRLMSTITATPDWLFTRLV